MNLTLKETLLRGIFPFRARQIIPLFAGLFFVLPSSLRAEGGLSESYTPCGSMGKCAEGSSCWIVGGEKICIPNGEKRCSEYYLKCSSVEGKKLCEPLCFEKVGGFGCNSVSNSWLGIETYGELTILVFWGLFLLPLFYRKR